MDIQGIAVIVYLFVGVVLTYYWFTRDYEKDYEKSIEKGEEVEKGMANLLMLMMTAFWPIILIKNLIKRKTL
jgi:CHASE3 domain sensor protein